MLSFKQRLKSVGMWIVRGRFYSGPGAWWFFGLDSVISMIIGTYFSLKSSLLEGVFLGALAYLLMAVTKAVLGYIDVRYIKRYQYEQDYVTRLIPLHKENYNMLKKLLREVEKDVQQK